MCFKKSAWVGLNKINITTCRVRKKDCVLIFLTTFVWYISYSKKNLARSYKRGSQDCVDGIVTTVRTGLFGLRISVGARDFFFVSKTVYTACVAHPAPYSMRTADLCRGWRWRIWYFDVGHSSTSISEVKHVWSSTSTPPACH